MFNNICLTIRRLSHVLEQYAYGAITHVNSEQSTDRLQPFLSHASGLTTNMSHRTVCFRVKGCIWGCMWIDEPLYSITFTGLMT